MIVDQIVILTILAAIFALFLWGRWRYDVVAFAALLIAVVVGVVAPGDAFAGFSHPATVTVATVLILSRALTNSGVTDLIARAIAPATHRTVTHLGALSGIAAVMSSFMNNVGALALLMPVAIRSAKQSERPASIILMPLSFASILGGLVTLIGTPPNIIIATYRGQVTGTPFKMFDFLPVGGVIALVGCVFVVVIGWRLIAGAGRARTAPQDLFQIDDYVTQARVPRGAKIVGMTFAEAEELASRSDAQIVGLTRRGRRYTSLPKRVPIAVSDRLIIEAGPAEIDKVITALGLKIVGTEGTKSALLHAEGSGPLEAVVQSGSRLEGRTVESMRFPSRYGVHLLAVSRQGRPFRDHLNALRFRVGDVLLLHGDLDQLPEIISSLGCLPLAERGLQFGAGQRIAVSVAIYGTAIAAGAMNILPLQVALGLAVVAMVITNIVPIRDLYEGIDWPVIVLLGAMIPIGGALESTGATDVIVNVIFELVSNIPAVFALILLFVVTMTLSDILNNAATAVVMAPIAVAVADRLSVNSDPFLMAVAVGASCAFLTPIGHQNNALIMGPGGYKFGDYWRLGLPLEILIVAVGTPVILMVWPL
jgi:di/tricarboxylate transporter